MRRWLRCLNSYTNQKALTKSGASFAYKFSRNLIYCFVEENKKTSKYKSEFFTNIVKQKGQEISTVQRKLMNSVSHDVNN